MLRLRTIKYFDVNTVGNDYIIGDIHGQYGKLRRLLKKANFNPYSGDRLFTVGDIIDKGPDSIKCLRLLRYSWFNSVIGNHEESFLDAIVNNVKGAMQYRIGGDNNNPWLDDLSKREMLEVISYIENLPRIIVVGAGQNRFNICHAEIMKFNQLANNNIVDNFDFDQDELICLTWGYNILENPEVPFHSSDLSITYVGHSEGTEVFSIGQQVYLDTESSGKLTMINHNTGNTMSI